MTTASFEIKPAWTAFSVCDEPHRAGWHVFADGEYVGTFRTRDEARTAIKQLRTTKGN